MQGFIQDLQIPQSKTSDGPLQQMDDTVTLKYSVDAYNGTAKATGSLSSGRHYGHYKASCGSDTLALINLIFMVRPFKTGIPLTWWTRSLHCIIQNKRNPYITKLRIVQLYEADFNTMLNILLSRRLMAHG